MEVLILISFGIYALSAMTTYCLVTNYASELSKESKYLAKEYTLVPIFNTISTFALFTEIITKKIYKD